MQQIEYHARRIYEILTWQKAILDNIVETEGQSEALAELRLDNNTLNNAAESLLRAIADRKAREQEQCSE